MSIWLGAVADRPRLSLLPVHLQSDVATRRQGAVFGHQNQLPLNSLPARCAPSRDLASVHVPSAQIPKLTAVNEFGTLPEEALNFLSFARGVSLAVRRRSGSIRC